MDVIVTQEAEQQLDSLYRYIARQSYQDRAASYIDRILEFCQGLSTFPQRGTRRDDLKPGLRIIPFDKRVNIAFLLTDQAVIIAGIYYAGRDYEADYARSEDA